MNNLEQILEEFFKSPVDLPKEAKEVKIGQVWWESRDGWLYPWRITKHTETKAEGYPCGEPQKKYKR